jgi:hypothetical protein
VEKSFRMSKTDLAARPIFHHIRDSIEAHLTIVFAALAVSRWVENTTGRSIKRFVTTTRRYRTIQIQAGQHTITAADPLPDDLCAALDTIYSPHQLAQVGAGQRRGRSGVRVGSVWKAGSAPGRQGSAATSTISAMAREFSQKAPLSPSA